MSVNLVNKKIIKLPDYLTPSSLAAFYDNINALSEMPAENVFLDCSTIKHVTSSHINLLWELRNKCNELGTKLYLNEISMGLDAVLNVLDIKHFFNISSYLNEYNATNCLSNKNLKEKQVFERNIVPDVKNINLLKKQLIEFLQSLNVGQLCIYEIETIIYEILTNIRLHGQLKKDDKIDLHLEMDMNGLDLIVIDPGVPFDPTISTQNYSPETAIKNKRKRGFGLFMIRKMTDNIYYERSKGKFNILTVEKKARH